MIEFLSNLGLFYLVLGVGVFFVNMVEYDGYWYDA